MEWTGDVVYNRRLIGNHINLFAIKGHKPLTYVAYPVATMPITLIDLKSNFRRLKPFYLPYLWKYSTIIYGICLHINRKVYVACNFNCLVET